MVAFLILKGAVLENNNARLARLLEKANSLPTRPGVYIMKNSAGTVIYVGKSRKLKNRVSQYFQNSHKDYKTTKMVAAVHDFDFFLCDTEMEALTLENVLIKEHFPRYNINLKDSKSKRRFSDSRLESLLKCAISPGIFYTVPERHTFLRKKRSRRPN